MLRGASTTHTARRVVALCWILILFDGYDLIMFGAIVPSLLDHPSWDVDTGDIGVLGAVALIGMLLGALLVGPLADRLGRRRLVIGCVTWFSVGMGVAAFAPTVETFGAVRFLVGLGLGGLLPTVSALTLEYAPPERRRFWYGVMFSGYPLGGLLAGILGIIVIPRLGFEGMLLIGMAALLTLPAVLRGLPESPAYLLARGHREEAVRQAERAGIPLNPTGENISMIDHRADTGGVRILFERRVLPATLLFWAATFCCLLLIYGLYTWLPQIMREAGYSLGSALGFLLTLNLGGVLGMLGAARAADRYGPKAAAATQCFLAATSIVFLGLGLPLLANYAFVVLAGSGAIGAQVIINAFVGEYYPPASRATALGWSLGIGRIGAIVGPPLGALIVGSAAGVIWNFYAFGMAALLAGVFLLLVPHVRQSVLVPVKATA